MSTMRAPRAPSPERAGQERWLLIGLLVALLAPPAFPAWLAGVFALREGKVRRRTLLAIAGAILLVHAARHGFDPGRIGRTHFTFWLDVMPRFMENAGQPEWHPLRDLGLGFFLSGLLGFVYLSIPLGLVLACVSMYGRKPAQPEWSAEATRAREVERMAMLGQARTLALDPPELAGGVPALGAVMAGDLEWSVMVRYGRKPGASAPWLRFPEETLSYPRVMVGEPGFGKTWTALRLVYTFSRMGYQVVFVDGKGTDDSLPAKVISAFLQGGGGSEILVYPDEPATMWRGTPRDVVQKVLSVWTFAEQHQFFEAVAENGLALAIDVPGAPPVQSSTELLRRLDVKELTRLHQRFGTPESRSTLGQITRLKEWGLDGFALRLRSLLRSVGPTLDGQRGFEDVDLAVLTVPSGLKRKDASATIRVLLEEFGMYASGRKGTRPCLLIFDEFSALQGGRATAMDLVERLRSTTTEVVLGAQSFEGLGRIDEARRILNAASGGVMLFRTPSPDEFVRLAGSVQIPDLSHNVDHYGLTDRGIVRSKGGFRVDPDQVRQLVAGECFYITGGRAARLFVATTAIQPWAVEQATEEIVLARRRGRQAERQRLREQEGIRDEEEAGLAEGDRAAI